MIDLGDLLLVVSDLFAVPVLGVTLQKSKEPHLDVWNIFLQGHIAGDTLKCTSDHQSNMQDGWCVHKINFSFYSCSKANHHN
jgi:hypothetical protein